MVEGVVRPLGGDEAVAQDYAECFVLLEGGPRRVGSEGSEQLTESLGLKYPQDLSEFGAGDLVGGDGEDYVGAAAGGFSEVGVFGSVG